VGCGGGDPLGVHVGLLLLLPPALLPELQQQQPAAS
jgi:hypothetical protein